MQAAQRRQDSQDTSNCGGHNGPARHEHGRKSRRSPSASRALPAPVPQVCAGDAGQTVEQEQSVRRHPVLDIDRTQLSD